MLRAHLVMVLCHRLELTQHLYRCDPGGPLPEHVVVSATVIPGQGPETYIFAADSAGEITDWCELSGSAKGDLDVLAALHRAGYSTTPSALN